MQLSVERTDQRFYVAVSGEVDLATEFAWAERTLDQVKTRSSAMAEKAKSKVKRKNNS